MYRLYWIRFVDEKAKLVHKIQYDDIISTEKFTAKYIESERVRIEDTYKIPIEVDPFYKQIPHIDGITVVIDTVCRYLDLGKDQVLSKLRNRELAYARKYISHICIELGYYETDIAKVSGIDRASVYNQSYTLKELMLKYSEMNKDYEEIVKLVKNELNQTHERDS